MKKTAVFIHVLTLFFCLTSVSFAYEAIPFRNGGHIEGVVEFTGISFQRIRHLRSVRTWKYCGKEHRTERYLINEERRIKNVVVYLKEIKAGKAVPEETVTVNDSQCTFIPM
jgi:hypothetical protein